MRASRCVGQVTVLDIALAVAAIGPPERDLCLFFCISPVDFPVALDSWRARNVTYTIARLYENATRAATTIGITQSRGFFRGLPAQKAYNVMAWQRNSLLITPPFREFFRSESSINRSAAPPSAVCVHASHAALAPAFSSHSSSLHIVLKTRSLAGDQDQVHSPQHCSSLPHNPHILPACASPWCV